MALALAGLLTVTACTSDSATGNAASSDDPLWTDVATELAWELDGYTPFGALSSASVVFVMHALDEDDELVAMGVDAETGDIEWTYPVGSVGSAPRFCGDDDEMECLNTWVRGSGDDASYQFIALDVNNGLPLSTTPLDGRFMTMRTGILARWRVGTRAMTTAKF